MDKKLSYQPNPARGIILNPYGQYWSSRITGVLHAAIFSIAVVRRAMVDIFRKRQEPCCIAASLFNKKATEIVALHGRQFTIEGAFRDTKDLHFGMALSATPHDPSPGVRLDRKAHLDELFPFDWIAWDCVRLRSAEPHTTLDVSAAPPSRF